MKILHYVSNFSLLTETFIYDLINNLEENGFDNYILTHNRTLEDKRPFSKVKVINENVSLIKKVYCKLFESWSIRNKKDVFEYINEIKPDIIHAHFGPNGVKVASLSKIKKFKIPIIISMHGTDTTYYPLQYDSYNRKLKDLAQLKNISFTFPSKFLKDEFEKNIKVKLGLNSFIIPNSFNKIFTKKKETYFKNGDKLKLVSIGRLIGVKGFSYLIKAVSLLENTYDNWELIIIGDGDDKNKLIKYAKELGVSNKIKFYGFVSHDKIPEILAMSDIYIQPSIVDPVTNQTESFGVAVIEAIISGLPVIVSDVGGLPDTVLGGHKDFAKIVKPKSSSEIYNAISEIMQNNTNNVSFRKKIEKTYSKQIQIQNIVNVYALAQGKKDVK